MFGIRNEEKKKTHRNLSILDGYFFGPVSIRRTFSGKTKTRCSRTLLPMPRFWFERWWWSSNDVALCLLERLFVERADPPTAPAPPAFLIKCLFGIAIVDEDELNVAFSCIIFIPDVVVKLVDSEDELFPLGLYW